MEIRETLYHFSNVKCCINVQLTNLIFMLIHLLNSNALTLLHSLTNYK